MKKSINPDKLKKLKRRNLQIFTFGNLSFGFADSCIMIVIIPLYMELTGSEFITGLLITFFMLMAFLPAPISGKLSDKYGRRIMKMIGHPLIIVGFFLLIFASKNALFLLILSIIFRGLGSSSEPINYQMMVAESIDESRYGKGFVFGFRAFLYFFGIMMGSIFVSLTDFKLREYIIVFLVISSVVWFINTIFLTETHYPVVSKEDDPKVKVWREILKNPKIKFTMIILTIDIFIWQITGSVYNAGLQENFNVTVDDLALLTLAFSISMIIFQIPAGKLIDKIGIKKSLVLSISFGLIIFPLNITIWIIWNLGNTSLLIPLLVLCQIFWGATASTFIPSELSMMTDLGESRKGENFGTVHAVRGLGGIPTGFLGGLLIEYVHFLTPFIITTIGVMIEIWYIIKFGDNLTDIEEKPVITKIEEKGLLEFPYEP
ncbi:MAG: MFS transporter [Candidatus Thorarchaeota archaeon]